METSAKQRIIDIINGYLLTYKITENYMPAKVKRDILGSPEIYDGILKIDKKTFEQKYFPNKSYEFAEMILVPKSAEEIYLKIFVQNQQNGNNPNPPPQKQAAPAQQMMAQGPPNPQLPIKRPANAITKVEIRISNQNVFDELKEIKSQIEKQGFNLNSILENARRHFVNKKLQTKTCGSFWKTDQQGNTLLFAEITGVQQASGGGAAGGTPIYLLPEEFRYYLLPDSVQIVALDPPNIIEQEDMIFSTQLKLVQAQQNQRLEHMHQAERENYEIDQKFKLKRLKKFILYFRESKVNYPMIEKSDLQQAEAHINQDFIGIEAFMSKFVRKLDLFSSPIFNSPKGILLYGPPGTGKSAITKAFCERSGMIFVTAPMAAGDLKKGIVGDSEKTLNEMSQRAKLVPWDLVVALIDEIDSLVPDRNDKNASGGSANDLMSVILAILDGSKVTQNLKIIASTNLLNKMDAAFLRRMEIQLFLGNPSKNSRVKWIKMKLAECERKLKGMKELHLDQLKKVMSRANICDAIVGGTVNFSADSLRKLLDNFFHLILNRKESDHFDWLPELQLTIKEISEEYKNYLGPQTIIEILEEKGTFNQHLNKDAMKDFLKYADNAVIPDNYVATKRILFNLSPHDDYMNELVQVELMKKSDWDPGEQFFYDIFRGFASRDDANQFLILHHLIVAIVFFKNVQFSFGDNIKLYNEISSVIRNTKEAEQILTILGQNREIAVECLANPKLFTDHQIIDYEVYTLASDMNCVIEDLKNKFKKYIVRFDIPKAFVSFINSIKPQMAFRRKIHCCETIKDKTLFKKSWVWQITQFAYENDADVVKLIDSYMLQQNNAFDDQTAMSFISSFTEEMKRYDRAVIAFDLDSIAMVTEEYSGNKEKLQAPSHVGLLGGNNMSTYSYSMQRPQTFHQVLTILSKATVYGNCWYIAVSGNNKIILDFMERTQWEKPESVLFFEQQELDKDRPYRCKICGEIFRERENEKDFKCKIHRNYTHVMKEVGQDKQVISLDDAYGDIIAGNSFECMYKHVCCNQTLGSKGEDPARHVKGDAILDPRELENGQDARTGQALNFIGKRETFFKAQEIQRQHQ